MEYIPINLVKVSSNPYKVFEYEGVLENKLLFLLPLLDEFNTKWVDVME